MSKLLTMLVVVVGLLLGGHFLVFWFVTETLPVGDPTARMVLFAVLAGLAISFPASSSLLHLRANRFSEGLYILAATWLGLFLNLLLAIGVALLARALAGLGGFALRGDLLALATGVGAVAVTLLGAWRAFHPRLEHVEVALAELPESWQGRRVVQLSDVHLGFINRERFARRVVATVREASPDLVVITGDLVDGMGGDVPRLLAALDGLDAPHGVYFTSGNHEVYSGIGRFRRALKSTRIQLLDDEIVELDGLRLIGIAYPGLRGQRGQALLSKLLAARAEGGASILLFHTPTDFDHVRDNLVDQHFSAYWVPETSCARARELGIGLQLSGHTHAGQQFPFNLVARWIFKGRHYGLHRDGDFQLFVSSGTGTWGPPIRTGSRSEITVFTLRRA